MSVARELGEKQFDFTIQLLRQHDKAISANDAGKIAQHLQREFERKYEAMIGMGR